MPLRVMVSERVADALALDGDGRAMVTPGSSPSGGGRPRGALPLRRARVLLGLALAAISQARAGELGPAVKLGSASDAWVATGDDGTIHAVYDGRHRSGKSVNAMGRESRIPDAKGFANPKIDVDPNGRPHVVFQKGYTKKATTSWYTVLRGSRWLQPEKFADIAEIAGKRAYVPDVAADARGNVLCAFWGARKPYYRWRTPKGQWQELRFLKAHWSASPKVEEHKGLFYLLYQAKGNTWKIAGPVRPGGIFKDGVSCRSRSLKLNVQNEGANFAVTPRGYFVAASNIRKAFLGPVGIWAAANDTGKMKCDFLGAFPGTKRGDESGMHPDVAYDAETGDVYVTVRNPKDRWAYYAVRRKGAWSPYQRLYPERDDAQATLRCGPSVADIPGPGVVVCVRNRRTVYLRVVGAQRRGRSR